MHREIIQRRTGNQLACAENEPVRSIVWGAVKTIIFEGSRHAREASQGAPEHEAPIVTTPTVQEELISGLMDAAWVESIFRQTRLISWLPSSGQGHPAA